MKQSTIAFLAAALLSALLGAHAYGQAATGDTGDTTAMPPAGTTATTPGTTTSPATTPSGTAGSTMDRSTTSDTSTDTTRSTMDRSTTETSSMDMNADRSTARLPSTATPLWLLGVVNGLWVGGLAMALRFVRRPR